MRFACTQCGRCCNRSPEVELSEAAALADSFVFRLMFRLYWLPSQPSGHGHPGSVAAFYERKRLLNAFAVRKSSAKGSVGGKTVPYVRYLVISALALDTTPGRCAALSGTACSIHERRPPGCRSVPLHYSRPEASAEDDIRTFVATDGYRCDTSDGAPVILRDGRIVDEEINAARADAIALAARDRAWGEAVARRLGRRASPIDILPSVAEIEASAKTGALTVAMSEAWQIAVENRMMDRRDYHQLIETQAELIEREITAGGATPDNLDTLRSMLSDYRALLSLSPKGEGLTPRPHQ